MTSKTPQKGAWIGSFKPKRQNLYIAISTELLSRRTSQWRTEFRPRKALRVYLSHCRNLLKSNCFVGGPPLSQSKYNMADGRHLENRYDVIFQRHISAVVAPIWTNFGSLMQKNMQITANWSISKPEVEFQYGGRLYFENGNSYISAAG